MDALVILLVGGLVAIGLWSWLAPRAGRGQAGTAGARRPAGVVGLRSAREITEDREALEAEDLAQMLAAHNAWQRRRGRPERTLEDVELLVASDRGERRRRQESELAARDLDELLQATNARRRARGLPERTREDLGREFGRS